MPPPSRFVRRNLSCALPSSLSLCRIASMCEQNPKECGVEIAHEPIPRPKTQNRHGIGNSSKARCRKSKKHFRSFFAQNRTLTSEKGTVFSPEIQRRWFSVNITKFISLGPAVLLSHKHLFLYFFLWLEKIQVCCLENFNLETCTYLYRNVLAKHSAFNPNM